MLERAYAKRQADSYYRTLKHQELEKANTTAAEMCEAESLHKKLNYQVLSSSSSIRQLPLYLLSRTLEVYTVKKIKLKKLQSEIPGTAKDYRWGG